MTTWHQLLKLWYGWGEKEIVRITFFFLFCRQIVTLFPRCLLLLGSIVSLLERKARTWPRSPNRCPRSVSSFPKPSSNSRDLFFIEPVVDVLLLLCLQVHIEFTEGEDKITLEGPTKDVQMVQGQIEAIVADLVSAELPESHSCNSIDHDCCFVLILTFILQVSRMDYTEISVDPKFHRHLIGKGGVNSKYSSYVVVVSASIESLS